MKGMDRFHPSGKESAKMRQILGFTATGTPTVLLDSLHNYLPSVIGFLQQEWHCES